MAATDPSDKGIAEAFKTFPFATDQEYQVSHSCSLGLDEGPLTFSILYLLIDGSTKHPGE